MIFNHGIGVAQGEIALDQTPRGETR